MLINACSHALVCWLVLSVSLSAEPAKIYVSLDGDDRWSGRRDAVSDDRTDGPKATVAGALLAARILKTNQVSDGVMILLHGGTYELTQPISLTPADSGLGPNRPLTITAVPGEKPILSGGRRITGWRKVEGKADLWEAEIPEVRAGQWYFRQLFINGQRKQRARSPNQGFFRIQGQSPQSHPLKLSYRPGDIKSEWAASGDVEVIALLAWADLRMQIRHVDETAHVVTLSGEPRPSNQENNARYYIENASDALDSAGEWYLDKMTGRVRYQADPSEDLSKAEVVAPKLHDLLWLRGDFTRKRPVEWINLFGLTFSYTDWDLNEHGYADTQAAIAILGDVLAEGAVDCRIENCTLSHLAGYALEFGKGCQRNKIIGNELSDLGAGGIRIGEGSVSLEPFQSNYGHVITDNEISGLGRIFPAGVGILVLQSGDNLIAHNHIHDLYYTAISVGWNWGYQETPCRNNIIEYNHLHDIGQSMLSDMGAIYTLGIQKGSIIRNNLIHDVNSFTYGGWGLYPDEGSSDIVWENNVVYRTKSAGFHQHYGRENIVRNNIFAFGKEYQLMRTRDEAHISFLFFNNIVYFDSGELLGSNWKNDRYLADFNLYFRVGAEPESATFSGASVEQWHARGHDVHSIITDPLFIAPDQYDFKLKTNSPALALGFRPIDVSQVGVRLPGQRAAP